MKTNIERKRRRLINIVNIIRIFYDILNSLSRAKIENENESIEINLLHVNAKENVIAIEKETEIRTAAKKTRKRKD